MFTIATVFKSKTHYLSTAHCSNLTGLLPLFMLPPEFLRALYLILKFKPDHITSHWKPYDEFSLALTLTCIHVLVPICFSSCDSSQAPHSHWAPGALAKLIPMMEMDACPPFCLKYSSSRYFHEQLFHPSGPRSNITPYLRFLLREALFTTQSKEELPHSPQSLTLFNFSLTYTILKLSFFIILILLKNIRCF